MTEPRVSLSEADLVAGGLGQGTVRPWIRSECCCCGGVIRVEDAGDDWLVARAVRVHGSSAAHAQWAIAAGWR